MEKGIRQWEREGRKKRDRREEGERSPLRKECERLWQMTRNRYSGSGKRGKCGWETVEAEDKRAEGLGDRGGVNESSGWAIGPRYLVRVD